MKSAGHNQPAHRRLKWNQNGGRLPKQAPHKIGSQINWNSNQSISQCNNRHSCLHNCTSARSSLRYDTPFLETRIKWESRFFNFSPSHYIASGDAWQFAICQLSYQLLLLWIATTSSGQATFRVSFLHFEYVGSTEKEFWFSPVDLWWL